MKISAINEILQNIDLKIAQKIDIFTEALIQ